MTDGVYRDPIGARHERALDLNREIAKAEKEMAELSPEMESLSAACQRFLTPNAAASGWYRVGKVLGVLVVLVGGLAWAAYVFVDWFHP